MSRFAEPVMDSNFQSRGLLSSPRAEFRPLPFLRNRHLQTLLGHLLPAPSFKHPSEARLLHLPDGDALVLHDSVPPDWHAGQPIVVVIHGLTGSHNSAQVRRIALDVLRRKKRVVRLDLRGSGHGLHLSRGFYHAGCSDDVRIALAEIHRWCPTSPLILVGVSLGGNIALKLAGEAATDPVPGLIRVAALAPPIDLEACVRLLSRGVNRIYERSFLRDLVREAELRQQHFPELPQVRWPARMNMRMFDDIYTAPRQGFVDSADYYRRASSKPYIAKIQVPTFIMTAADDPFVAVEPFHALQAPDHVTIKVHPYGGHLGFLGWDGAGGIRWGERQMIEWALV